MKNANFFVFPQDEIEYRVNIVSMYLFIAFILSNLQKIQINLRVNQGIYIHAVFF